MPNSAAAFRLVVAPTKCRPMSVPPWSMNHCRATAAVRVTVIVKDAGECGPQSTYEATSQLLSKAFDDGTTFAGLDRSTVVEERSEGREIQVKIKKERK